MAQDLWGHCRVSFSNVIDEDKAATPHQQGSCLDPTGSQLVREMSI
jgi:hypothetical protein